MKNYLEFVLGGHTWNIFYARLHCLMDSYQDRKDEVGRLVRHLRDEMDRLWLFLQKKGVGAASNLAERNPRFAVLWRKRSFGTRVDKGDSFVERALTLSIGPATPAAATL